VKQTLHTGARANSQSGTTVLLPLGAEGEGSDRSVSTGQGRAIKFAFRFFQARAAARGDPLNNGHTSFVRT